MANTWTCLHYHIVFSTRNREPWLKGELKGRAWAYIAGIAWQNEMQPVRIGGMADHIHLLLGLKPVVSVSDAVKQIKGGSSKWVKAELPGCKSFSWQDGYGAFCVSKSQVPVIDTYIREQEEHHKTKTFQEEFRALLERHEVKYDERYLWG
jgi:putative transposase